MGKGGARARVGVIYGKSHEEKVLRLTMTPASKRRASDQPIVVMF
jgi:hypothetical protein